MSIICFHKYEKNDFILFLSFFECSAPPKKQTGKDLSEIAGGWSGKTWDFLGVKVLILRYFELDEQIAPKGLIRH